MNYYKKNSKFLLIKCKSLVGFLLILLMLQITVEAQLHSPVNLGTSEDFVILTKTGITTSGTTSIVGNIGVSPLAATSITGFGLIMDPSGTFSTSSLVTGKVYAADYSSPTPSKMTTAIGDMETASSDAAGRLNPNFNELYSGDLSGKILIPGLYKWTTNVLVSDAGVTLTGSANDVWIFQISQDLILSNGAIVNLTGGAQVSNIFWQVSGQTTLGTSSEMKGIILCETKIEMNSSATLNGRALAKTAVTLVANSISISGLTSIKNENIVPKEFSLSQNYPNPFNPSTVVNYQLSAFSNVKLTVYNVLGNEITTLVNEVKEVGSYQVEFNSDKYKLSSGVYYYTLRAGDFVQTKKMLLMK